MHSGTYDVSTLHYDRERHVFTPTPEEFRTHWNSDYSGDIWFTGVSSSRVEHEDGAELVEAIKLPYELLEKIVMSKLRNELISKIEQMEQSEFKDLLKVLL